MEYGLIGNPLGHSYSARIHGMIGDYDYRPYPMEPETMRALLKSRAFKGLNVTIPYKRDVLPLCDELSDDVREIGSANTLVVRNGRLIAHNTDLGGLVSLAERAGVEIAGKKAVVLGGGGTSLTARTACRRLGAREVVVVSRSGPVDYEALYRDHADAEVLINTTPVGMHPQTLQSPVDIGRFPNLSGVLDAVYNPDRTLLVMDALERNIPAAGGLWMLVRQALLSSEIFTDTQIPVARAEEIYRALLADRLNLVLIGMPGSGKTTLGQAIADRLGRPFVDTDLEIERAIGMPIPDYFALRGEREFRAIEAQIVRDAGKESGTVISTGGGAPMFPENVRALRQNGLMLHITRPAELLSSENRPLSGDVYALRAMEQKRTPVYRACEDMHVENVGEMGSVVERAVCAFSAAVAER